MFGTLSYKKVLVEGIDFAAHKYVIHKYIWLVPVPIFFKFIWLVGFVSF